MKKILVITLLALMLLGSGFTGMAEEFGKKNTFFMASYQSVDYGLENSVPMIAVTQTNLESLGAKSVAKTAASQLEKMPDGRRVLNINTCTNKIFNFGMEEDFFYEKGIDAVYKDIDALFSALKENNAKIDYISDDNEGGRSVYEFENRAIGKYMKAGDDVYASIAQNGDKYEPFIKEELMKIEKSSIYQTALKPLLDKYGFVYGKNYDLEYLNIFPGAQEPRKTKFYESNPPDGAEYSYVIFNDVMGELYHNAYNKAVTETILKYYPNVKIANYDGKYYMGGDYMLPDSNGNKHVFTLNRGDVNSAMGNASSYVNYGEWGGISKSPPEEYPYEVFKTTMFNTLVYAQILMEHQVMYVEKHNTSHMPWVTVKTLLNDPHYLNYQNTYYYEESVFHTLLKDPRPLLAFDAGSSGSGGVAGDMEYLSKLMNEVDELCGFEDRKAIAPTMQSMTKWDQRYILSGMYAGGKNVWRITPDLYTPGVDINNFCIDKNTPTFQIGNQFVEFPAGSYIYENDSAMSEYGYWIISPKGTKPKQYRDDSIPEPDEPVETADYVPDGYKQPIKKNGKVATLINRSYEEVKKPTKTDNTDDIEQEELHSTLKIKKISFKGKRTRAVTEKLPADIKGHWAEGTMANMLALGVMKGSEIGMEPDKVVNKAEFLTMLFRLFSVAEEEYDGSISDITQDAWYANTIYTAVKSGLIQAENGKAEPLKGLSRSETIEIFIRLLSDNAVAVENATNITFNDEAAISEKAVNAVKTAVSMGIIEGYPDGEFKPANLLTRAEVARILERYLNI